VNGLPCHPRPVASWRLGDTEMRFLFLMAIVLLATVSACSLSKRAPGSCLSDGECAATERCKLDSPMKNTCVPRDADGGGGETGGDARPGCNPACTDPAAPLCDTATRICVGCLVVGDCATATKPFCSSAEACVPCSSAGAGACAQKDAAHPVCGSTGACVECGADTDCHDLTKPFCSTAGACVSCAAAPSGTGACAVRNTAQPVCAPSGACVQCVINGDCSSTTPVCSAANTCGPCSADADCAGKPGPVVCMAHQDGRCATDAETIYVQNGAVCSDSAGAAGGAASAPFCSMQPAVGIVGALRDLVVVRGTVVAATSGFSGGSTQISIVGQMSAVIAGSITGSAIHIVAGDTFIRDIKLSSFSAIGCQADTGSTLRLDHVNVTGNSGGGILLDGAAFTITNTTVTNNGPGTFGPTNWGGIFVNNPPAAGPAQLQLVTVQNNNPVGISCSSTIQGTDVLASGNGSGGTDINSTCGFSSCGTAGITCGAQP
jgi:hypothetical protein